MAHLLLCFALLLSVKSEHTDGSGPVARVVSLLTEMQTTLKNEQQEDANIHEKMSCWCNENAYAKNNAASESSEKIEELKSLIEQLTAEIKQLKTEIAETEAQVAADKKALAEATELRKKQQEEFHAMEMDSVQQSEQLKGAVTVLSKHHKEDTVARNEAGDQLQSWSFLQRSPRLVAPSTLSASDKLIVDKALKVAAAFMQASGSEQYQPAYESQSGEIFGILKQMLEEMNADLKEAQDKENERANLFQELRASKTEQIEAGEKEAEEKEDRLADAGLELAEAKEDLEAEGGSLAESQEFLANLQKMCAASDKNFAIRQKARSEEIQAVSETITILTEDEARDAMTGTYGFVQVTAHQASAVRRKAARVLRAAAHRSHAPMLSALATSVELDAFTKVKQMISDMIEDLKKQQEDELVKHDSCNSEIQENEMQTLKTDDLKQDLVAKQDELEKKIALMTEEIAAHKKALSDAEINLQRETEDRLAENREFQITVMDQNAVQEVLKKALDKLAKFYDGDSFIQQASAGAARQTPPVTEMEYSKSKGATGVMSMIEKLIFEAKDMIKDSIKEENEAQAAYVAFVHDTNSQIAELQEQIVTKSKATAAAGKSLEETNSDIASTLKELEELAALNAELHTSCDYLIKNFDIRQKARSEETQALQQALQILSGADMS